MMKNEIKKTNRVVFFLLVFLFCSFLNFLLTYVYDSLVGKPFVFGDTVSTFFV